MSARTCLHHFALAVINTLVRAAVRAQSTESAQTSVACLLAGLYSVQAGLRPTGPQTRGPAHDRHTGVPRLQGGRRASPCTHLAPAKGTVARTCT